MLCGQGWSILSVAEFSYDALSITSLYLLQVDVSVFGYDQPSDVMRNSSFLRNFILGVFLGCFAGFLMQLFVLPRIRLLSNGPTKQPGMEEEGPLKDTTDNNLVLVGVMTAKAFLETRAIPAYDTWVSSIPGKVIYWCFISETK
jgi:hypothetical protein